MVEYQNRYKKLSGYISESMKVYSNIKFGASFDLANQCRTRYNCIMRPIDDDYFISIGKILTFAGAIEDGINEILALEYVGVGSEHQRPLIDDIFDTDKLSFGAKIDLLLRITKRRKIEFNIIDRQELKRIVEIRNHIAHF